MPNATISPTSAYGWDNCRTQDDAGYSRPPADSQSPEMQGEEPVMGEHPTNVDPTTCSYCKAQANSFVLCSRCDSGIYCNSACRKAHWWEHKFVCRLGRSIDVADYLVRFCQNRDYPQDNEVATVFGFRHFISATDRLQLFRLYCKLVNVGGVDDEELRKAWRNDELKEFILFRGSQLPPGIIKEELDWFRMHDRFAANSTTDFGQILDTARDVLNSSEEDDPLNQLDSEAKQHAYMFYCQIRNGYVPDADEDNWLELGFCTAQGQSGLQRIAETYKALIERCTFTEFWRAMEDSTMVKLFNKYGLGPNIKALRNFEALLDDVGKWHQSVWELKRFTLLGGHEPMRAIASTTDSCIARVPRSASAFVLRTPSSFRWAWMKWDCIRRAWKGGWRHS